MLQHRERSHLAQKLAEMHLRGRLPEAYSDATWLLDAQHYEPFGLTLAQMYCYLDQFQDGDISPEKLAAINNLVLELEKNTLNLGSEVTYQGDQYMESAKIAEEQ